MLVRSGMPGDVRILLLADSHLGFDLPVRPRVERRRRGHDFLANYHAALAPALAGEVDVVVHAGDVFDRSRVVSSLAFQAFDPLCRVADAGVPVFIVPGNHERSRLPHLRFAAHPGIHVFDRPRTWTVNVRGTAVAIAGFPYEREVRSRFAGVLEATGWRQADATRRVLCMHQCVEGASVGPVNYTFTTAEDVVRIRDIPGEFSVAFSGHIHRHQVLTTDLSRRPVETPVLYPGSIERTAFAEIGEPKGFMIITLSSGGARPGARWEFRELPARPMIRVALAANELTDAAFANAVECVIAASPANAVLAIRVTGVLTGAQSRALSPKRLREMAPPTMNVDVSRPDVLMAAPRSRRVAQKGDPRAQLALTLSP